MPNPTHYHTNRSQFGDDARQWAVSKNIDLAAEHLQPKISLFKNIGQQKVGSKSHNHFANYKQCVRPIFEYGIVSTTTVSETVITKIQRVQNSFIRLALRLPKYVSARLLHEASGLPYVRERLITVGQNHLARMHVNPLVEHTVNSARTIIASDK